MVVSLNTLSHLPEESQITALTNLSSCCKPSSYFFVNASVDSNLSALTHLLLSKFDSVEPIYLNSFKSCADEDNGVVNEDNVKDLVRINEETLPNDASLHKGVLFCCTKGSRTLNPSPAPLFHTFNPSKIHLLNHIPSVRTIEFPNDSDFLNHLRQSPSNSFVVISSRLYSYSGFGHFLSLLQSSSISYAVLDDTVTPPPNSITFCIGLEAEWTQDEAIDRVLLNRLRELPSVNIHLCFIRQRFGTPSSSFPDLFGLLISPVHLYCVLFTTLHLC